MEGTQLTLNFDAITETAAQTFEAPTGKTIDITDFAKHDAVDGLGFVDDGNYYAVLKSGQSIHFKSVGVGGHLYGCVFIKENGATVYRHDIKVNQDEDDNYWGELDAFDFACAKILESALN